MIELLELKVDVFIPAKLEEQETRRTQEERICPCFGKCGGVYGCPRNYEDCLEFNP